MKIVALDAMGGDNAPLAAVNGAVMAVNTVNDVSVILTGKEDEINAILSGLKYDESRISVVNATEVIEMNEHPVEAIKKKKDSSMTVAMKKVHDGEADAFVGAGNSGALMVGAQVLIGRQKGVERSPFAHLIPHAKGLSLLLDCGANVDVRPEHLITFAKLGSEYYQSQMGIQNPRVGIINIGAEKEKGNALVKEAFPLLEKCDEINFVGSIEPTGITAGEADVLVCDGFVGNVVIKLYEGMGKLMMRTVKDGLMSTFSSKIGALLVKKPLKEKFKAFDAKEFGGAPILGLKGLAVKVHGNADDTIFRNAILQCLKGDKYGA